MNNKIKIGLIGFGRLGEIHARNIILSNIAELSIVCDINTNALNRAKTQYGVNVTADINEFLAYEPLDGIVIASSTSCHLELIDAVSTKGIPIFTEKPIGLTLEQTDKVLQKVVDNEAPFQIGFQRRWDPQYRKVKSIVESGEIGKPILLKTYSRDPNASKPENWGLDKNGGLFLNAGIHDYDISRFILGDEVDRISATGATLIYPDLASVGDIDTCSTTLFMKNGTMAMTECNRYATYGYDVGMEIICTEGIIKIGHERNSSVVVLHKNKKAPSVYDVFADAFSSEIEGFLRAIIEKSPMSPGIEDARIALQLAIKARESYESESKVVIVEPLSPLNIKPE